MNQGVGMSGVTGAEGEAAIDAQDAVAIMREARERARRELEVTNPLLFVVWGLSVLVCYGVLWLAVRDQKPYRGLFATGAGGLIVVLITVSLIARLAIVGRALGGVEGRLSRQWLMFFLALGVGTTALWLEAGALSHAGASPQVVDLAVASAPIVSMGLAFFAGSAIGLDRLTLALGGWLLAVAAGGAWAGPVTALAIYALAGGGGLLAMGGLRAWLRRG
jgi:hypothetical protein